MFSTRKTVTLVAVALAGALSAGAVASAQAQAGPAQSGPAQSGPSTPSDLRTPAPSVSLMPVGGDDGIRGDGTPDRDAGLAVTPTTTPAPVPL